MATELIYEQTVQAIAAGILLSAPRCAVCADSGGAVCHCRQGFSWFSLDEPAEAAGRSDHPGAGRLAAPAPVHSTDATVVMPAVSDEPPIAAAS